ncbi:MAG TPA: DUF3419 family protein, partial [Candidatus Limnocylindrales bacterium]
LRIPAGGTVLAIAAAGDNVLALLQDDPARILAIDVNPAQTALLRLKMAAIARLAGPAQVAAFLGAVPAADRAATYRRFVRLALPDEVARYWDGHLAAIERGVIHAGRFERYLALFRRTVLPLVPGRRAVREFLAARSLVEQRRVYETAWNSRRWRLLFRVFFGRRLLRGLGRDPVFFAHCEVAGVGSHYLARAEHALLDIPIWTNPWAAYMLAGGFGPEDRLPDYLRPGPQACIRDRLDRVEIRTASLDEVLRSLPAASVDACYLSDVFELSAPAEYAATLAEIARVARPGARICYWNNLVPRRRPASLAARLAPDDREAERLHGVDRAFLYSRFVIETVRAAT